MAESHRPAQVLRQLASVKRLYNAQVDANVSVERELHAARVAVAQLEAQRDFLLERLVDVEGAAWEVSSEGEERPLLVLPATRRRAGRAEAAAAVATTLVGAGARAKRSKLTSAAAASAAPAQEDRTGMCTASIKSGKLCRRKATAGFVYCAYHLPLDESSGFVYCVHRKAGGKACGNPVMRYALCSSLGGGVLLHISLGGSGCGLESLFFLRHFDNRLSQEGDRLCKYHRPSGADGNGPSNRQLADALYDEEDDD